MTLRSQADQDEKKVAASLRRSFKRMQTSFGSLAMEEAISKKNFKKIFELTRVDTVEEAAEALKEVVTHGEDLT